MGLLNKLLGKKEEKIQTYEDFWNWFVANERTFYKVVKTGKNIETAFFDKLSPKLEEIKEDIFYLTGMYDNNTAELVLTPDGGLKNIFFVEELVSAVPTIPNWKFTALKPALDIENVNPLSVELAEHSTDYPIKNRVSDSVYFHHNMIYENYPGK